MNVVPRALRTQMMNQGINSIVSSKMLNEPMKTMLGVNFCYCFYRKLTMSMNDNAKLKMQV